MTNISDDLIGQSAEFCNVLNSAQLIAATDVAVLIQGESGTGKERFAHHIHRNSPRKQAPMISINCAALPESLAEAELFGHAKGAFTGASQARTGRIRAAQGGTLFLDEIGELPLSVQGKLLRFLESGECQPLGETRAQQVDVRIIAATNRDLQTMVDAGHFRQDLFYRLNIVPLQLPTLRERKADLSTLLEHFSQLLAARHGLQAPRFHKQALKALKHYHWPGNIRELRNFCERMVVLFSGKEVMLENLPFDIRNEQPKTSNGFTLPDNGISLDELEQSCIVQALQKTRGNRSRAARLLGLSRDTLLYRMKKFAIQG